jgi:hypothetical protein
MFYLSNVTIHLRLNIQLKVTTKFQHLDIKYLTRKCCYYYMLIFNNNTNDIKSIIWFGKGNKFISFIISSEIRKKSRPPQFSLYLYIRFRTFRFIRFEGCACVLSNELEIYKKKRKKEKRGVPSIITL